MDGILLKKSDLDQVGLKPLGFIVEENAIIFQEMETESRWVLREVKENRFKLLRIFNI